VSDFKTRMIEAIERGDASEATAYEYVRELLADAADMRRKADRENREEVPHETHETTDR